MSTQPSKTTEAFNPDRLIAGDYPVVTGNVTIESGQNLTRGALLGRVTAGGEYKLSLSGAADGSEVPRAILAEDVDASAAAKIGPAYLSGEFNEDQITFGTAHTAASVADGLRDLNIYLKSPISA